MNIHMVEIPQLVKIRKEEVDKNKLVPFLRKLKNEGGWINKDLAEELDLPLTTVEHWFRTDKYFTVPEPDVWLELKKLFGVEGVTEFDYPIMTFEYREGVYDKANRYYFTDGISPTLVANTDVMIILEDYK